MISEVKRKIQVKCGLLDNDLILTFMGKHLEGE